MADTPIDEHEISEPPAPGWSGRTRFFAGVGALVVAAGTGVALSGAMADGDDPPAAAADAPTYDGAGSGSLQGRGGQGGSFGTITAIDGETFTLATQSSDTVDVTVDGDTVITDTTEGSLDDLAVGDNVRILGEAGDGDAVSARQIVDAGDNADLLAAGGMGGAGAPPAGDMSELPEGAAPPEGMEPPAGTPQGGGYGNGGDGGFGGGMTVGTIAAIDGDTLAVTTSEGDTVTVTASDDTNVRLTRELAFTDLAVDDTVTVRGTTSDDVLTATSVQRGDAGFGPGGGTRPGGATAPDDDNS